MDVEMSRLAQFDAMINGASKSVQRLKEIYMEPYQLSAAHTDCLCRILNSENGLSQQELIALEQMDKAQVSRVLNGLIKRGFVTSNTPGSYRKRYQLTESGRTAALEVRDMILRINQFVSSGITDEEIALFYRIFGRINEQLTAAVNMSRSGDDALFESRNEP